MPWDWTPEDPVSPAHAGIDLDPAQVKAAEERFPRTRGDRPSRNGNGGRGNAFPPHTRG